MCLEVTKVLWLIRKYMFIFSSPTFSVDLIAMIILKGKNNYCFSYNKLQDSFSPSEISNFEEERKFANLRNNFEEKNTRKFIIFPSPVSSVDLNAMIVSIGRQKQLLLEVIKRKCGQREGKTKSCTTNFLSCKRLLIIFRNQINSLNFQFFIVPWGNPTSLISVDSKNLKIAKMLSLVLRKIKPTPQVA